MQLKFAPQIKWVVPIPQIVRTQDEYIHNQQNKVIPLVCISHWRVWDTVFNRLSFSGFLYIPTKKTRALIRAQVSHVGSMNLVPISNQVNLQTPLGEKL